MFDKMNSAVSVSDSAAVAAAAVEESKPLQALPPPLQPHLNAEQIAALQAVRDRKNVFISGPGGTGKSFLIRYMKEHAPPGIKIAVTALTGCAAILLDCGAKTLHSWAGIGLGRESAEELVQKIQKRRKYNPIHYKNWTSTDILVIDEISMMPAELFEKLNRIGQLLRKQPSEPFGGLQIVALGDFFQLPPIVKDLSGGDAAAAAHLTFNAPTWSDTFSETVQLRQIMRQTDPVFQELLNSFRCGEIRDDHVTILRSRMNLDWDGLEIKPTLIFPRRTEVDRINAANLAALEGESYTYATKTEFKDTAPAGVIASAATPEGQQLIERFDGDAPYNTVETLTIGAQVMLIHNKDQDAGLVNGSRGVITKFIPSGTGSERIPVVLFKNGVETPVGRHTWEMDTLPGLCRSQVPLRLAYACTIHKSQGASLDCALIDIGSSVWEYGQAYVALSRVRSLDGLYVFSFDKRAVKAHPVVRAFYRKLNAKEA